MIQLCNRSVLTLSEDGTTDFFRSDELQQKLERSCIAAGLNATWIAEDIALSVEYSLGEIGKDKVFTDTEIDSIVVKILQEAGLSSVAAHYQLEQINHETNLIFESSNIKEIVNRYLDLNGEELEYIVEKVTEAGKKLFLRDASPTLILELSKHFLNKKTIKKGNPSARETEFCPWLISKDDILKHISEEAQLLVNSEIIELSGISRLFPSIRIKLKLANFAVSNGFNPPVPEFILLSSLPELATAIDSVIDSVIKIIKDLPDHIEDLPVYLFFSDAPEFTDRWLAGKWIENKECFEELVSELKAQISNRVLTYT